ncbi:hypothetical protein [Microbacterium sp. gxy059]|uniref:hypothetical protein n=1 Tax=Microbacterium sp. gxy059 TaxID=2957199 RepID=UPI003D9947D7
MIGAVVVVGVIVLEIADGPGLSPKFGGAMLAGLLLLVGSLLGLRRSSLATACRIDRFAERNGMRFDRWRGRSGYAGMPFAYGNGHQRLHVVRGRRDGIPVEFGNLQYDTVRAIPRRCGYVAIRLPERLPHMVLDARHSSALFGLTLPVPPHASQRVDVGAGRSFTPYAVDGADRVARTMFAPDVLALFQEVAKRFDIEIVGDMLFLYSRGDASTNSAKRWGRQLSLVDALVAAIPTWSVWELARRQNRGRGAHYPAMRTSHARQTVVPVAIGAAAAAIIITLFFVFGS